MAVVYSRVSAGSPAVRAVEILAIGASAAIPVAAAAEAAAPVVAALGAVVLVATALRTTEDAQRQLVVRVEAIAEQGGARWATRRKGLESIQQQNP